LFRKYGMVANIIRGLKGYYAIYLTRIAL